MEKLDPEKAADILEEMAPDAAADLGPDLRRRVAALGSATFTVFTIPTAQSLLERIGKFDAISVAAKSGTTPQKLVQEIRPVLPVDAQVRTA